MPPSGFAGHLGDVGVDGSQAGIGDRALELLAVAREVWLGADAGVAWDMKRRDDALDATFGRLDCTW